LSIEQQQQEEEEEEERQQHEIGEEEERGKSHGHKEQDRHDNRASSSSSSSSSSCPSLSNTKEPIIKKQNTSDAYALHFETISPNAYLTLINRGWRRSGKLLYLPRNWSSCCPAIPIRLETTRFQISKSQRKLISKFQRCFTLDDASRNDDHNGSYHHDNKVNGRGRGRGHECTIPSQDPKRPKHFSTGTTKESESSIVPVLFQQPSCIRASDHVKNIQCRAKHIVMHDHSSLLSFLESIVRNQLHNLLLDLGRNTKSKSEETWETRLENIQNKMDKLCSWKCTKVSKSSQPWLDSKATVVVDVTLTNTVSPALHGMTGGKIDQRVVVRKLVSCLQYSMEGQGLNHDDGNDGNDENDSLDLKGVSIGNVTSHEPSGHIHVVVRVTVGLDDNQHFKHDPKEDQREAFNHDNNTGCKQDDIIGQFISSTLNHGKGDLNQNDLSPPYRISVKSVPSNISACMPHVHRLYCKYQHAIHGDDDPYVGMDQRLVSDDDNLHNSKTFQASCEDAKDKLDDDVDDDQQYDNYDDDDGDDQESNCNHDGSQKRMTKEQWKALYPEYDQDQINKIYKNYNGFYRFLCSSPMPRHVQNAKQKMRDSSEYLRGVTTLVHDCDVSNKSGSQELSNPFQIQDADVTIPYGSYHQHYLINDKYLFAVGVVDILPQCLSSVYSFYDPELSRTLNLGKITALYEIEWVKRAMRFRQDLRYYYLGYYIHSCQKMKYKAQFKPSELLCPVRGVWVDFEQAEKRLEDRSPIRHCCNISTPDEEYFGKKLKAPKSDPTDNEKEKESVVNRILFDIGAGTYLTLNMVTDEAKEIIYPLLESLVEEVGMDIASECVVKLC
jgi:arginine-tRNA-protein transferase